MPGLRLPTGKEKKAAMRRRRLREPGAWEALIGLGRMGPAGGRRTFHGAERRKCCVRGRGNLGRRVFGPDNFGERGTRCYSHGARSSGFGSAWTQRPLGAPEGGGIWELYLFHPHLSAPKTVIRATAVSYEQVEYSHWVVRVALLEKGVPFSRTNREGAPH